MFIPFPFMSQSSLIKAAIRRAESGKDGSSIPMRYKRDHPTDCTLQTIYHEQIVNMENGQIKTPIISTINEFMIYQTMNGGIQVVVSVTYDSMKKAKQAKNRLIAIGASPANITLFQKRKKRKADPSSNSDNDNEEIEDNDHDLVNLRYVDPFYKKKPNLRKLCKLGIDTGIRLCATGFIPVVEDLSHIHKTNLTSMERRMMFNHSQSFGAFVSRQLGQTKRTFDDSGMEEYGDENEDENAEDEYVPIHLDKIQRRIPRILPADACDVDIVTFPDFTQQYYAVDPSTNEDIPARFHIVDDIKNGEFTSKLERAYYYISQYVRKGDNEMSRDASSAAPNVVIDVSGASGGAQLDTEGGSNSYVINNIASDGAEEENEQTRKAIEIKQNDHQINTSNQLKSSLAQIVSSQWTMQNFMKRTNPLPYIPLDDQYHNIIGNEFTKYRNALSWLYVPGKPIAIPGPPAGDAAHLLSKQDLVSKICNVYGMEGSMLNPPEGEYKETANRLADITTVTQQKYLQLISDALEDFIRQIDHEWVEALEIALAGGLTDVSISIECKLVKGETAERLWHTGAITGECYSSILKEQMRFGDEEVTGADSLEVQQTQLATLQTTENISIQKQTMENNKSVQERQLKMQEGQMKMEKSMIPEQKGLIQAQTKATEVSAMVAKTNAKKPTSKK